MTAALLGGGASPWLVALLALLFPGGIIAFLKYKPEQRNLVITEVQGATTILNGVIEALEAQHDRDQLAIEQLTRRVEGLEHELAELQARTRQ